MKDAYLLADKINISANLIANEIRLLNLHDKSFSLLPYLSQMKENLGLLALFITHSLTSDHKNHFTALDKAARAILASDCCNISTRYDKNNTYKMLANSVLKLIEDYQQQIQVSDTPGKERIAKFNESTQQFRLYQSYKSETIQQDVKKEAGEVDNDNKTIFTS